MINAIRQGSILDWLSRPIAAWIVLVISLCFTAFAWQLSDRSIEERAQDRFNADSQSIVKQIQDRMRDYEQVLRSGVGLFMSSHDVSRAEWHTYVEELNLAEVYPGMQAMGVSPKINAKDIQKHITSVRAEGFPAYNIYPLRESDAYYPVLYIEPFNERNQRAFGYDMFSHPVRRNAMTKAIDSGQPTLSGAITLVQESGQNIQRGFLYYLPVYKKNMPVDTVEQRRKAFDLFVYGAFRANDLIFGILSNAHPTLGIELFDGAQEAPSEIIYTNLPEQRFNTIAPVFRNDMHITVGGHQWVIRITSKPAFIATINKNQNYIILISGLLLNIMLFSVMHSYAKRRQLEDKSNEAMLRTMIDKAENASKVKSQFLANMSHEIRTPLHAIMGLAQLCLKTELSHKQRGYLQKIFNASEILLEVINDVLDFSKIEAGKLKVEFIAFSLHSVLDDVFVFLQQKAIEKHIHLNMEKPENLDYFKGDPLRLSQILINLVTNAIKFTDKGSVTVSVSQLAVEGETCTLQFKVVDTGIGMSPEQCGRLFQSFEQIDASTTRKYGGTGLGLAISKQLVEIMGGVIRVESKVNQGSAFVFTVCLGIDQATPLMTGDELDDKAAAENNKKNIHHRILVVDDVEVNRDIACEFLSLEGYDAVTAASGAEAIECVKQQSFDAILMDIQMPDMDGIQAALFIQQIPKAAHIPIIAMTANAMKADRDRYLAAGMSDHVPKPIDPEQLFHSLTEALTRQKNRADFQ